MPGEVSILRSGSTMWIASPDGTVHGSVLRT
jgi:hypothetical protein